MHAHANVKRSAAGSDAPPLNVGNQLFDLFLDVFELGIDLERLAERLQGARLLLVTLQDEA